MFNRQVLNPAYTGSRGAMSISGIYRSQWSGMKGGPKTQIISAHSPFYSNNGVGMLLFRDQVGVAETMGFNFSFSHSLKFEESTLAIGLQGGLLSQKIRWTQDVVIDETDPAFSADSRTFLLPDFGAGLFYHAKNHFLGLSIPHLSYNRLSYGSRPDSANPVFGMDPVNIYLSGGYIWSFDENLKIKPTVLLDYQHTSSLSIDANINFLFYEILWVGAGIRNKNELIFLTQCDIRKNFTIGYSFDLLSGKLGAANRLSHEIMLRYDIFPKERSAVNPRYF